MSRDLYQKIIFGEFFLLLCRIVAQRLNLIIVKRYENVVFFSEKKEIHRQSKHAQEMGKNEKRKK